MARIMAQPFTQITLNAQWRRAGGTAWNDFHILHEIQNDVADFAIEMENPSGLSIPRRTNSRHPPHERPRA
jgi:hypothetical protein